MNYLLPIAAVVIGFVFVMLFKPSKQANLKLLLAFSGAFLLSITVFHLLPSLYEHDNASKIGLFIMLGILLQIFLEFFSKGAEHGHVHYHSKQNLFPWVLFISLSIHSILEGFPIHTHETVVYGIVVHKIPIAIILTSFFMTSQLGNVKTLLFLTLFAVMTPLGTFLSEHVEALLQYSTQLTALVVGIFLHISTTILFESSEGHKFNITKLVVIVLAIAVAYFI